MRIFAQTMIFFLAMACLCACLPVGQGTRGDRNTITPEEVQSAGVSNAYQLVERLRPLWLRSRGGRSVRLETEILVYLDGAMLGDLDSLRTIPIDIVVSLRALDSAEAMRLPGLGSRHVERAIMVVTRVPDAHGKVGAG